MDIKIKTFEELTKEELYLLLQLRSEVFVVEQDCVYQDIDGKDEKAHHVLGFKEDKLVAYTRVFKSGDYFTEASIGRVVVQESQRRFKLGFTIMEASIAFAKERLQEKSIHISAQCYLIGFYESLGFEAKGEEYLEDGIPHVGMYLVVS